MIFDAIGDALGGVFDDLTGKSAARDSANAQAAGQRAALDELQRQFDVSAEALAPFQAIGQNALVELERLQAGDISGFYQDPGFQFQREAGLKAIQRSAARRGLLLSGAQLQALQDYSQGLAANAYDQYVNRLLDIVDIGQNASSQLSDVARVNGERQANALIGLGNARASAFSGGFNNQVNTLLGGLQTAGGLGLKLF